MGRAAAAGAKRPELQELDELVRAKALEIFERLLAQGYEEGHAIATTVGQAQSWALDQASSGAQRLHRPAS
jgi:uncharacterized protein YdaT